MRELLYRRSNDLAAAKAITDEAYSITRDGIPDDWAAQVYGWLSDAECQALQEIDAPGGGGPSRDDIKPALVALGFLEPEED